jgi:hypothetical protein
MQRRTFLASLGAASLGLALGADRAPARDQVPTPDQLVGAWEGTVLFVDGRQARVRVELAAAPEGGVSGTYALTVLDEEGPGKARVGPVRVEADGVLLLGGSVAPMRCSGTISPAAPHAESAFHGAFGGPGYDRGVFMLFRYRG